MATRTKKQTIPAHFMAAFTGNLDRSSTEDVNEAVCDLEDLPWSFDDDYKIRYEDLPPQIPQVVRKQMVEKSRQVFALQRELADMMEQLNKVACKTLDRKEREDERAQPHCDKCGQVIKSKRRK